METFTSYNQILIFKEELCMSKMDLCIYLIRTRPNFTVSERGTPGSQIQLKIQGETNPMISDPSQGHGVASWPKVPPQNSKRAGYFAAEIF
jgi:hypothetical protein